MVVGRSTSSFSTNTSDKHTNKPVTEEQREPTITKEGAERNTTFMT